MKKISSLRMFILLFALLIFITTMLSGTFAVFSATYIWQSNSGIVGVFDYTDTSLPIDLFGDAEIFPSSFGSKKLDGVDFGDHGISWTFSQTDGEEIPILYYVFDGAAKSGYYSTYDYGASHPSAFIKIGDEYLPTSSVSTTASDLASELQIDSLVCWIWPDKLYAFSDPNYVEASGASYDEFLSGNENICKSFASYNFNYENIDSILITAKLSYVASDGAADESSFAVSQYTGSQFSVSSGGLLMYNGNYLSIFSNSLNGFTDPNAEYITADGDYYVMHSTALNTATAINSLNNSALNFEIILKAPDTTFTPYYINTEKTSISTTDSGWPQNFTVKILPLEARESKVITVSIIAEVTI